MTCSKRSTSRLTAGTIASPPATASAPPGQKSFCKSITTKAVGIVASSSSAPVYTRSDRHDVAFRLLGGEPGHPVGESTARDRLAQAARHVLVEVQVVPGQQHR